MRFESEDGKKEDEAAEPPPIAFLLGLYCGGSVMRLNRCLLMAHRIRLVPLCSTEALVSPLPRPPSPSPAPPA